ncbi:MULTISPECIES: DUF3618 domain-containing protein [unclassified Streptomyces]|uniref:DUF3618 domain-containing protein n=1 Tax=unclassified Streptomyces TaxID=2593676 RepID=UPI0029A8ECE0|nr:DUF3618 domain-containing protein [Streptomyces sp. DK15]MDX2389114.1 DUF3618 domain-containing protein [Streptomyces sp. DK15]
MTNHNDQAQPHDRSTTGGAPTPEELREQITHTRDELGRTVEALAAKADVRAQAKQKTAAVKQEASEKAALVTEQIREKAEHAADLVRDKTPDPILEKASRAAAQVRETTARAGQLASEKTPDPILERAGHAATAVRANLTPLLAAGAVLVVFLLIRRGRGRK